MKIHYCGGVLAAILMAPTAYTAGHPGPTPYAGEQSRSIKALSGDEVEDLLAGRGAGFAKAAELNGYPGPMHVLELAESLDLTPQQRAQTTTLLNEHKLNARTLGKALVEKEAALDAQFASASIDATKLRAAVAEIAALQGQLRTEHLATHLAQRAILSERQAQKYSELRGYSKKLTHQH